MYLDGPINAINLPAYDGEVVHTDRMSHGLALLIDGRGDSDVSFEPFPNGPMVFVDRQDYIRKTQHLLQDREIYRPITSDPTSRFKNKLLLMLRNTQQFLEHIKSVHQLQGEVMVFCEKRALFTSVPMDPAIHIVQTRVQQDPFSHKRQDIHAHPQIIMLELCLIILTSSSRVSILNSFIVWPCILPLAHSLSTWSLKSLKSRP